MHQPDENRPLPVVCGQAMLRLRQVCIAMLWKSILPTGPIRHATRTFLYATLRAKHMACSLDVPLIHLPCLPICLASFTLDFQVSVDLVSPL
jgi:hypothetical protein